jgi:hypothetical protein
VTQLRAWLVALGALLGAACSDSIGESDAAGLRAAIVNGEISDETDDAVVKVEASPEGGDASACTGTMIAPNLVVTALHCVAYYTGGRFRCNADGTLTSTEPKAGELGALASPEQIRILTGVTPSPEPIAVGARVFGTGATEICRNDFAVVLLDRDLDLPVVPLRLERSVRRAQSMRVVGYGSTEEGMSDVVRRYRAGVTVTDVGPDAFGQATTSAAPRTFVLSEGACFGDSGGPAFSEETGALVGVYSLSVGTTCTTQGVRNIYTKLSPFKSLVDQAFAAAGYEPLLEPPDPNEPEPVPPDPVDDPFAGSGSRSSGCSATGLPVKRSAAFAALGGLVLAAVTRRRRNDAAVTR